MKNYFIISILSVFLTNTICIPSSLVDTFYRIKNNRNEVISFKIDHKVFNLREDTLASGESYVDKSTNKEFQTPSSILNSVVIKDSDGTELLNLSGDALDTHFKKVERDRADTIAYRLDVN